MQPFVFFFQAVDCNLCIVTEQSVKIAPLFTRKADTQARQLFLQSGVPDQVKRTLETQRRYLHYLFKLIA